MTHPRPYYDRVADRRAHDKSVRDWESPPDAEYPEQPQVPNDSTFIEQPEPARKIRGLRIARAVLLVASAIVAFWAIGEIIGLVAYWSQPINLEQQK